MAEEKENTTDTQETEDNNSTETKTPNKTLTPEGERNVFAAISYVSFVSIIIYVLKKEDDYIEFHSRQGMVIFGLQIIGTLTFWFFLIGFPISILAFVLMIVGGVKAYKGERFRFPYIADLSEKIDF